MVLGLGLGILFGGRGEGALPYQCRLSHSEAGGKGAYRPIRCGIWCCHFEKMTRVWRSEKKGNKWFSSNQSLFLQFLINCATRDKKTPEPVKTLKSVAMEAMMQPRTKYNFSRKYQQQEIRIEWQQLLGSKARLRLLPGQWLSSSALMQIR